MLLQRLKNILLYTALMLLLTVDSFSDSFDNEPLAFASFIIELIRDTQTAKPGAICLFGSDEISHIIAKREKGVIQFDKLPNSLAACKVVYISKSMERGLRSEVEKFHNSKVMTIAIFDGFTEMGGMIQVQVGRRSFELIVNPKETKASGVKLSGLMTSLIIN